MERMVLVSIHQAITAAQKTPTEAILALIHTMDLLAGHTKFLVQRVTETIMPKQLV